MGIDFNMFRRLLTASLLLTIWTGRVNAQQIADTAYMPEIQQPEYHPGEGPVIFIDEGHHNFHTKDGRYSTFASVLERDGYSVKAYKGEFKSAHLAVGRILVISNALNKINVSNWSLPTASAFTADEIETVKTWVENGGSLFLIADHMPMAGAARDLAAAFGFEFTNGFAMEKGSGFGSKFTIKDGTLAESIVTKGRNADETVNEVVTFTGQAFKTPKRATPLLIFNDRFTNKLPKKAWQFDKDTREHGIKGWSQGAYMKFGNGRVVMSGEAAMFTAQLAGKNKVKVGMNSKVAKENYKLLLNIIHWLDGRLD